jgi:hypothetical protein
MREILPGQFYKMPSQAKAEVIRVVGTEVQLEYLTDSDKLGIQRGQLVEVTQKFLRGYCDWVDRGTHIASIYQMAAS